MSPLKLIYVAGAGHSGSTLLGRLLDRHPEVCSIGSIDGVRSALDREERFCGCGERPECCPLWGPVLQQLQRGEATRGDDLTIAADSFVATSQRVLRAIRTAAGVTHVCEATHNRKRPWRYAESGVATVYIVHLVRDPRGVTFSYERKGKATWKPIAGLYLNAFTHEWYRLKFRRSKSVRYLRIHYEDLCADPVTRLRGIARFAGLDPAKFEAANLTGGTSHLLQGNRMRHLPLNTIRRSTSFITQTNRRWWSVTTMLTLPLVLRYGYPLWRRPTASRVGKTARRIRVDLSRS